MKKLLSAILAAAIMLTSAAGVFAEESITVEKLNDYTFLRNDGALYSLSSDIDKDIELIDTDVIMACGGDQINRYYFKDDYKEYFKSINTVVYEEEGAEPSATIPDFKYMFDTYFFSTENGAVYFFESRNVNRYTLTHIADVGKIKETAYEYFLTADNTLYHCDVIYMKLEKIASDVKDFKISSSSVLYRTNNNDLYLYDYNGNNLLLADCSQFYSWDGTAMFAKGNNGKWYHMGNNRYFALEPEKKFDGNNITPDSFDTMIEATEYVYRYGGYYGSHEWNIDGNLYLCTKDSKELIAENIIYVQGQSFAVTADGDFIIINKASNIKGDFVDMNIKNPEKFSDFNAGVAYVNRDNNIVYTTKDTVEKKWILKEYKIGEKYPDRSDWANAEITAADEIGYIDSIKLLPMQNNIKREDFCNMIVDFCEKYLGKELSTTSNPFGDTENEKVIKAYANGIIAGVSSDKFAPDDQITREQMCAIMTRAAKFLKPDVQFGTPIAFSDMNKVSDWAVEGVNAMSGLGIVKGDGISITPRSDTSVEQAIAMTYRLYNKIR